MNTHIIEFTKFKFKLIFTLLLVSLFVIGVFYSIFVYKLIIGIIAIIPLLVGFFLLYFLFYFFEFFILNSKSDVLFRFSKIKKSNLFLILISIVFKKIKKEFSNAI